MPRFVEPLARLGKSWEVEDDLMREFKKYTCAMYGNSIFISVDDLRLFKIKENFDGKPCATLARERYRRAENV